jgi:hypothetical protein
MMGFCFLVGDEMSEGWKGKGRGGRRVWIGKGKGKGKGIQHTQKYHSNFPTREQEGDGE